MFDIIKCDDVLHGCAQVINHKLHHVKVSDGNFSLMQRQATKILDSSLHAHPWYGTVECVYLVYSAGNQQPIGAAFLGISIDCACDEKDYQQLQIWIDQAHRAKGIATSIISKVIKEHKGRIQFKYEFIDRKSFYSSEDNARPDTFCIS